MLIAPLSQALNARVSVPGSKSITNRALLIASLANGKSRLNNALFSDDSRYFAGALSDLGLALELDQKKTHMTVSGLGGVIPSKKAELFIGNAGTAARFLTAFLTLGSGEYILDGDARMRERPIGDLASALEQLGAKIKGVTNHGSEVTPPLHISAAGLSGGKTKIAGSISSQFLSGLLMIAPYARSPVEIEITSKLNSKPYVDLTLLIMKDFGVEVDRDGYAHFMVNPAQYTPISNYLIESDASAASYFFAAPAICGGKVLVENISRKSRQGDLAFLNVLSQMGCQVTETSTGVEVSNLTELKGVDVDMSDFSDTAQTLAVIAPFASSPTRIRGIASARVKETDRVSATCTELARLGVRIEEYEDGMTIFPCTDFRPANIETYNDHRMAMAFSLIGLRVPGITIENPGCVSKTFPNFFDELEALR
ncbi:MAG: 3-phosphoshikimate 1-carboxyvinyltransferase [Anaerolineae bacterium]|nr:3-phosphoshikimate 1-carboxyvinyltransferase [Anaerolineae bacterium]MDK1080439.1 3-phosphoshikimate 1-carboxyvinyltransferase [Anaerolineae bacterium]